MFFVFVFERTYAIVSLNSNVIKFLNTSNPTGAIVDRLLWLALVKSVSSNGRFIRDDDDDELSL